MFLFASRVSPHSHCPCVSHACLDPFSHPAYASLGFAFLLVRAIIFDRDSLHPWGHVSIRGWTGTVLDGCFAFETWVEYVCLCWRWLHALVLPEYSCFNEHATRLLTRVPVSLQCMPLPSTSNFTNEVVGLMLIPCLDANVYVYECIPLACFTVPQPCMCS